MSIRLLPPRARRSFVRFLSVLTCLCAASAAPGQVSDAQVFQVIRQIQAEYTRAEQENFQGAKQNARDMILRGIEGLPLDQLTPEQVVLLEAIINRGVYPDMSPEQRQLYRVSVARAAERQDAVGAIALIFLTQVEWDSTGEHHFTRLLEHPGLPEAMHGWASNSVINMFGSLDADVLLGHLDTVERLIMGIPPHTRGGPLVRPSLMRLFDNLDDPAIAQRTRAARARIHAHLLTLARATLSRYSPTESSYHNEKHWIVAAQDVLEYLESPASQGSLVGKPAPEIEFIWYRGPGEAATTLSDLRGKVVVLDFWATWCGPCIAMFPTLERVRQAFADKGVVVVGLTSVQGFHVPPGGRPVRFGPEEPDPVGKELAMMEGYMAEKAMSWNVAFSSRSVLDPRYRVWGIPHLVIIDRDGVVRFEAVGGKRYEDLAGEIERLLD